MISRGTRIKTIVLAKRRLVSAIKLGLELNRIDSLLNYSDDDLGMRRKGRAAVVASRDRDLQACIAEYNQNHSPPYK